MSPGGRSLQCTLSAVRIERWCLKWCVDLLLLLAEIKNMAMNKSERATFAYLRTMLALHITEAVEPDIAPPAKSNALRKGWLFNVHSQRVEIACTSGVSHSFGQDDQARSQGTRRLFSSRLLALRALRYATEQECAKKLRDIDRQIETEVA